MSFIFLMYKTFLVYQSQINVQTKKSKQKMYKMKPKSIIVTFVIRISKQNINLAREYILLRFVLFHWVSNFCQSVWNVQVLILGFKETVIFLSLQNDQICICKKNIFLISIGNKMNSKLAREKTLRREAIFMWFVP